MKKIIVFAFVLISTASFAQFSKGSIYARYNLGLTKLNEGITTQSEVKNQVIQVSLGYKLFKFGK